MVDVVTETNIKCPRDYVAEYAADPDHAPKWYINIKSAEWKTEKPLALGSKIAFTAEFLGRKMEYVYEVVEYHPGHRMVMRTIDGPFPMETTYTWVANEDNHTLMTLRNKGVPSGFSKIFTPFMSVMMKKANRKDLKKLRGILENNYFKA